GTRLLAFLIRIIPKIGPFSSLSFRTPTPETEKMFMASFSAAVQSYGSLVQEKNRTGSVALLNDNFDTGAVTAPGEYPLADRTYARLLQRLADKHFKDVSPQIRATLLDYYDDPRARAATTKSSKKWAETQKQIEMLRASTPASADGR